MTKDSFNRKKNYSNTKIIQLDPLGERLSNVGMTGGAINLDKGDDIEFIVKCYNDIALFRWDSRYGFYLCKYHIS